MRTPTPGRQAALRIASRPNERCPTANIFRALANAPALLDAFLSYANALRDGSELSPKLRELAILTVGHTTDSEYEIAHHQSHGAKAGITPEQLAAVPDFETSDLFDDAERAVMALAKESTAGPGDRRHLGAPAPPTSTTGRWSSSP